MIKNSRFEEGHFHWNTHIGSYFHIIPDVTKVSERNRGFIGRQRITTSSYNSPSFTISRFYQRIKIPNTRRVWLTAYSRIERLYHRGVDWRLEAYVYYGDRNPYYAFEEYDANGEGWQVRSLEICFNNFYKLSGNAVNFIDAGGMFAGYRGSVLWDSIVMTVE